MPIAPLQVISRIAATVSESDGLRAGSSIAAEIIMASLSAEVSFIALRSSDDSVAEIIATNGFRAAEYRRLEERLAKSGLWRSLSRSEPMVVDDLGIDPVLNFLAFGSAVKTIVSVPIVLGAKAIGMVAVGYSAAAKFDERSVIQLLTASASVIAQAVKVEEIGADENQRLAKENRSLKQELRDKYDLGLIIGNSAPIRRIYEQVSHVSRSAAPVLLLGERGTGKEMIANILHFKSLRSNRPFVIVDCSTLPPTQIDLELFGVDPSQPGKLKKADGGTLFIDEIGNLSATSQKKLLNALEQQEKATAERDTLVLNIRLVAGTSGDLELSVQTDIFSKALYGRINSFPIHLPPLRERKSDILQLAEHFLEKYMAIHNKNIRRISTPAIDMLTSYHFPGNISELENVIERAVITCTTNVMHGHDLPPTLQTGEISGTSTKLTLADAVAAFESDMIADVLKSTHGNIARAAAVLDSTERILGYKIKKYGILVDRFKK